MKRWMAFFLLVVIVLVPLMGFAEVPHVTYEQIVSGEYNGQTVEANAKAYAIPKFYNLIYVWAVEKEDGTFDVVDKKDSSNWCLGEEKYKKASADKKKAISNGDVLVLTINLAKDGWLRITEFRLPGTMTRSESVRAALWGFSAAFVVLIIFSVIWNKHLKKHPPKPKPVPIKTKFVDSYTIVRPGGLGRTIIGTLVAGKVGAIIGAASTRDREFHRTTFMVYYSDGSHKIETVNNGNYLYKKYMNLLDMGDKEVMLP